MADSALGTAASGQIWEDSGNWAIEESDQPYALFGNSIIMPFYNAENTAIYGPGSGGDGHITLPQIVDNPVKLGRGGVNTDPLTLMLDRPTSLFGWASANLTNDATSQSYNARFFLGFTVDGTANWGGQTNIWCAFADNANGAQRLAFTMHQMFVYATPDDPVTVQCWWGYLCDDPDSARFCTIRNQKMEVMTNYAPDYTPTSPSNPVPKYSTKRRALWTPFGLNRKAYRGYTGNP